MVDFYMIERLQRTSAVVIDWDRLEFINENWNEFTEQEYYRLIDYLKDNQMDAITSGFNYNQTDIRKHLKKLR